ncbi:MAG: hypothetical protein JWQ71_1536 [Pedosphaera sp.]|nr:hypothetical protein [Pedosphaera sp.]
MRNIFGFIKLRHNTIMRCLTLGLAFALGLTGCRTPHKDGQTKVTPTTNAPIVQPAPYTRIANPDTNTIQLQIAVRKLVPTGRHGPVIWLVGTSHIGEPSYYQDLQKHLNAQTLVLYEGVNAGAHKRHVKKPGKAPTNSDSEVEPEPLASHESHASEGPSMQATMAKSLGLVFQLDAIDYDRTNFLNSDLSIQEIQNLMAGVEKNTPAPPAGQGSSPANPSFSYLMQIMDESSLLGSIMKLGMQFIGSNPKLQAMAKLTLIETLGRLKGEFSEMRGVTPDLKQLIKILIDARNQNVVEDLKTELKIVPRRGSIAVFYGTGHMEDMQKRITSEMKYQPAGEVWFTAFSVDLKKTGLSQSEVQMVRNLVEWQMKQLQP